MLISTVAYLGLVVAMAGLVCMVKPIRWLQIQARRRAAAVAGMGVVVIAIALALPAPESRIDRAKSRLDEIATVWQFREFHTIRVAAPPERVFDAIKRVRIAVSITWRKIEAFVRRAD